MSLFDGKPIGRIDLGARRWNGWKDAVIVMPIAPYVDQNEQDRIWRLVKMAAEGTNISTPEGA